MPYAADLQTFKVIQTTRAFFVTVRAGTAYRHLFPSKEKKLFVMYIINE